MLIYRIPRVLWLNLGIFFPLAKRTSVEIGNSRQARPSASVRNRLSSRRRNMYDCKPPLKSMGRGDRVGWKKEQKEERRGQDVKISRVEQEAITCGMGRLLTKKWPETTKTQNGSITSLLIPDYAGALWPDLPAGERASAEIKSNGSARPSASARSRFLPAAEVRTAATI